MSRNTTFYGVAVSCVEQYKQNFKNEEVEEYVDTLFVAVDEENKVKYSLTPDVLSEDTKYAILIHQKSKIAVTNWYSWYDVETIDQELCVKSNLLDDRFKLEVKEEAHFYNQMISLRINDAFPGLVYKCKWPSWSQLQTIWDVYQKCLDCKTDAEAQLLGKLAMADQKILQLEKDSANDSYMKMLLTAERDKYKSMLDEISKMVAELKKV